MKIIIKNYSKFEIFIYYLEDYIHLGHFTKSEDPLYVTFGIKT